MTTPLALLVFDDGHVFRGRPWGATGRAVGSMVINTSISGYQTAVTDPKNAGSLLVMTSPHVGNVGVHDADAASDRCHASGIIVREPARLASNWQSSGEFEPLLVTGGVVGICRVDTRAITQLVVAHPQIRAGIFSGDALPESVVDLNPTTPLPHSVVDTLTSYVRSEQQETR
ncbi:MAG: carbamoyl-phosphate synthase domain-containing protein [Actinomycetaceae bacterium]|nr:carbamoyl-phosphate synthase domain-containing protein [Actinomycetaceae bacterium]